MDHCGNYYRAGSSVTLEIISSSINRPFFDSKAVVALVPIIEDDNSLLLPVMEDLFSR